jgi:excisionase family DNA binding protein
MTSHDRATTGDASKILGIPARTIRRWVTDGRLTAIRLRGTTYVSVSETAALRKIIRAQAAHIAGQRNRRRVRVAQAPQNGPSL